MTSRKGILLQRQGFSESNPPSFDFHMHTNWTDGESPVTEMHNESVRVGLSSILFSEHARSTSDSWFSRFADQVRALPAERCKSLVGVEAKVNDFEGNLDCTTGIIACCDLVMASVHRFPGEVGVLKSGLNGRSPEDVIETEFRLAFAAMQNPEVDILGHPFGMCYRRFGVTPPDEIIRRLIDKAALSGVAFEVNSRYHPNPKELLAWCREAGATVSLGSNAHSRSEVGQIIRALR